MDIYKEGRKWHRCITVYPNVMRYDAIAIYQWDDYQNEGKMGLYVVIATNVELMKMQGLHHKNWIMTCIVDDFGNLVRKPE
jgi:hypothetical protein